MFVTQSACVGAEKHFCLEQNVVRGGVVMTIDPICKMKVDEKKAKFKSEYQGKKYYFCSAQCKREFDKNPKKYA